MTTLFGSLLQTVLCVVVESGRGDAGAGDAGGFAAADCTVCCCRVGPR